jgi:hypothetical protein
MRKRRIIVTVKTRPMIFIKPTARHVPVINIDWKRICNNKYRQCLTLPSLISHAVEDTERKPDDDFVRSRDLSVHHPASIVPAPAVNKTPSRKHTKRKLAADKVADNDIQKRIGGDSTVGWQHTGKRSESISGKSARVKTYWSQQI